MRFSRLLYGSLARTAAEAGAWDDALGALKARKGAYDPHDTWETIGRMALEAGALEPAAKAFAEGKSLGSRVGAAVVAKLCGQDAAADVKTARKTIEDELKRVDECLKKDEAAGRTKPDADVLNYVAKLLIHRVTLEMIGGDATAAIETRREAIRRCGERVKGEPRASLDAYARAAGLRDAL